MRAGNKSNNVRSWTVCCCCGKHIEDFPSPLPAFAYSRSMYYLQTTIFSDRRMSGKVRNIMLATVSNIMLATKCPYHPYTLTSFITITIIIKAGWLRRSWDHPYIHNLEAIICICYHLQVNPQLSSPTSLETRTRREEKRVKIRRQHIVIVYSCKF